MRAIKGKPTESSQKGLKQSQIAQNYFLACSCYPQEEMEVVLPDTQLFRKTTEVVDKTLLGDSVLRLRLARPHDFTYFAGQYVTIFKNKTLGRSYSLASVPELDNFLEFHIKIIPGGKLSQWLANELSIGAIITVSEALGNCLYLEASRERPMAFIGTSTGLAPLYGVLRDALHRGHQGEIRLYHGVRSHNELYLHNELLQLANQHPNFSYIPCLSREAVEPPLRHGRASNIAIEEIGKFNGWCVYLCGNPDMVNTSKRAIFLAGASLQDIFADPFIHS